MTQGEREALACALALLEHGFPDYAETILRVLAGAPGRTALYALPNPVRAAAAIREALADDA